jgi:dienelactone hydrolase
LIGPLRVWDHAAMLNPLRILPKLLVATLWLALQGHALAEIKTEVVDYKQGDTVLQGFVAWDDAIPGKRPGVLVVHEWWGHNQHARNQAERLAKAGYVGFALDMYGKGKVASHPKDAQAFVAEATENPKVERARFDAALALLKKRKEVNPAKIAAIGYCFGGGVVLDMVRQGEPLAAAVTFHGALSSKLTAKKPVKTRILVLAGEDDPMVGKAQVEAFRKEMTDAGAHFRVVEYPGAKHGFTNPDADKFGVPGLEYNAKADQQSWEELVVFFKEIFGPPR